MTHDERNLPAHLPGEQLPVEPKGPPGPVMIDSWAGQIRVEWDNTKPLTPLGQAPFFIQFLKVSGVFDALVADAPIERTSPNASSNRDCLGSIVLSMLAGHKRYAHITALRADGVLPELLGMSRMLSEDTVRRWLAGIEESRGIGWLQRHLDFCTAPLTGEPWILDADTTIKPLYGHQEGALLGYNPKKPGRPSHAYHSYILANVRLAMDVEVMPGNQHAAKNSAPELWALLERIGRDRWPRFLRADKGYTSETLMRECEEHGLRYLLKLRLTKKVKQAIARMAGKGDWKDAGRGWQGIDASLALSGWSKARRVVLLRRASRRKRDAGEAGGQLLLSFAAVDVQEGEYEYSVLVTSLDDEILSLGQLYRDRADCENAFDELKNQWGWGGFTTHDLARCQIAARLVALVYNWWNLFTRLAKPDEHLEAITSRPLLLASIAERTTHARQTTLRIASAHAKAGWAASALTGIAGFLEGLMSLAEQLTPLQRWYRILSHALRHFLAGRELRPPPRLPAPAI